MLWLLPLIALTLVPDFPRITRAVVGVSTEAALIAVFALAFVARNGAARIDPSGTRIIRGRTTITVATATSFRAWAPHPKTMLAEVSSTHGAAIAFRLTTEKVDLNDAQRRALLSFLQRATLQVPDASDPSRFDGSYPTRDEAIELIEGDSERESA